MRVFVFSSLLLLAVTGCKPFWDPTYMPTGYAYHQENYKSPPGPEAADLGYDYSAAKNNEVMTQWRNAVRDLLLRAKAHDLRPAASVYLSTDLNESAFQSAYDSALRDELRVQGYELTDDPALGTHLFYSAYDPADHQDPEYVTGYNDDADHPHVDGAHVPPSKNMELVLAKINDGRMGHKVSSLYEVPLYGFKPAAYAPPHARPLPAGTSE